MEASILKSVKKLLAVGDDDTAFDLDIMIHINSAFSTLSDLGVGPADGFSIEDDTAEWESYISDDLILLSKVKTCVYIETRLLFDPPTTSFALEAAQKQLLEAQWRLNVNREATAWVDPAPPAPVDQHCPSS